MPSFGFHYFPDETHYRTTDLQAWLPELRALGARWLTLVGSLTRSVPEHFVKGLIAAGIEPIIHIPAAPIRGLDLASLRPLLETYERWGVKHVVVFAEPNTRAAWAPADWHKTALAERFLDLLLPVLLAQAEAGLQPTFPPLRPGGELWDTGFLEAMLAGLARRELQDLAGRLTFAVNLWTFNHPVAWGAGGLKRWPAARPYVTPPGAQDQRGFHLFDWYNEILQARLGEPRPLLCLAGGPRLGDATDAQFPATDEARHASCIRDIADALAGGQVPANVLNINFWVLGAADGSPFSREAWYRPDGSTLAAVDVLKQLSVISQKTPKRKIAAGSGDQAKTLEHYLLLPTFEWGVSEWHWNAALNFVKAHRPASGFSVEEARQAQQVTIFGNEQGISAETERQLRQAGCAVRRIVPEGPSPRPDGEPARAAGG